MKMFLSEKITETGSRPAKIDLFVFTSYEDLNLKL